MNIRTSPHQADLFDTSAAVFSEDRKYRYLLTRHWGNGASYAMFIMLNPSTADETQDDPTIRRCIRFARTWGYDALAVCNLFAFRATSPARMKYAIEPVGPRNNFAILDAAKSASIIIAAWGVHGAFEMRGDEVRAMLRAHGYTLYALGITKDGQPRHPLYVRGDTALEPYTK